MEEIIAELQRIYNEPPPFNQLGLPSHYRNQIYDIQEVIRRLQSYCIVIQSHVTEFESI